MKKTVLVVIKSIFFLLIVLNSRAQSLSPSDTLKNETIIRLVKAKLSETVIIGKINRSICSFDVSTDGLISLKDNQVPDTVINTMIEKQGQGVVDTHTRPQPLPVGTEVEYTVTTSNQSSIPFIGYYDGEQNLVSITKAPSGWTLSFKTSKPNQRLMIHCSAKAHSNWFHYVPAPVQMALAGKDHPAISAVISVNGVVQKQATGQTIGLQYP